LSNIQDRATGLVPVFRMIRVKTLMRGAYAGSVLLQFS
jgi:hypothetical protein